MKGNKYVVEKTITNIAMEVVLFSLKWLFLILSVISAGLTAAYAIIYMVYGATTPSSLLLNLFEIITMTSTDYAKTVLETSGSTVFTLVAITYGVVEALTFGLYYVVTDKLKELLTNCETGDMFNAKNVKLINGTLPYAVLAGLAQPIIVSITMWSTGVLDEGKINFFGVILIAVVYILKIIFDNGYSTQRKNERFQKQLDDAKAAKSELEMELIAKEAIIKEDKKDIKELKAQLEGTNTKKTTTKKAEVKKEPAKVEVKEETSKSKKPRAKKGTTK